MKFDTEFLNIGYLDSLSYKNTPVHRIDPRIKIVVSALFVIMVVSFPKYELSGLLPFFIYPVFLLTLGDIPLSIIARKLLIVSPFVIFVGMFNPVIDRNVVGVFQGFSLAGGWISFVSIIIKFILTVSIAFLLVATTSFVGICEGLRRLKVPDVFIIQLLFLYRYMFVFLEEAFKMVRARNARSFGNRGRGIAAVTGMVSILLVRAMQRAERVYGAMVSRGFRGRITYARTGRINVSDVLFASGFSAMFIVMRFYDLPAIMDGAIKGILP